MKTKVLHVLGGMGRGGAPSFVINNLLRLNPEEIQFDFLVRKDNCAFHDEIESRGGRIFIVAPFPKNIWKNYKETKRVFQKYGEEYDAIHVHANALYYILPLLLAKKWRVKKIILHSHNTQSNVGLMKPLHYLNKMFVSKLANVFLACGEEAGHWMYGDRQFEVINNAVDTQKFAYNEEFRKMIRSELGISGDSCVIGNVGRFEEAKNHDFLIDVFSEYVKTHPNSILLLLGEGTLMDTIKRKVDHLGISSQVIFAGVRSDVNKFYSAMDVMLMPSLFEGLPFVAIEAQCSGLKTILSTSVTDEAIVTDICKSRSLKDSIHLWCSDIESIVDDKIQRESYSNVVKEYNYDINYTANRLLEIYTE